MDAAQLIKEVSENTDVFVATLEWRHEDGLEVLKILPGQYHMWAKMFSQEQTTGLPKHTKYIMNPPPPPPGSLLLLLVAYIA